MDNLFGKLQSDGVGSSSKAAAVFTREYEDKLWDLGVLGTENPKALLSLAQLRVSNKVVPVFAIPEA